MFTIEEAKAIRPSAQYTIPAGAKHEFGEDALKRGIEDHVSEQDTKTVNTLSSAVSRTWQKITSSLLAEAGTQRTAD